MALITPMSILISSSEKINKINEILIEKYEMFKAVTSICKKGIDNSYYHSFILDDENNVYVRVQTICR